MINKIAYLFILSFLLLACTTQITVDNPTAKDINLHIGKKQILVASNSTQKINIKNGQHFVSAINTEGDTLLYSNVDFNEKGLLNITNTHYYLWTDLFCEEKDFEKHKSNLQLKDTVIIDQFEFLDIDLVVLTNSFIPEKWDYAINEKMPEEMEISEELGYKIVSKLYNLQDLKEAFNYLGDLDLSDLTQEEINSIIEKRNQSKE